ncbi:Sedlin [Suhomyces tanzawaensis NRRL Y-17324]|uniref:Sedlin n=1 Tax=Suhomyces tanzawaensis NRRL Y-17324 TaxID=984487 RepID=A0A1E4SEQ2_9ASCO|nr:Sedlin [Suhomyces tanzawaensis NRRL Y-17324]ODV78009.1 Sedlin [Suhomyces tanzawaensis NRRL Y-17324]
MSVNSSTPQRVQFVSLISPNDKPLYIQAFDLPSIDSPDSESANRFLKYNFLSHMALDIFSSPASLSLREQQQQQQGESSDGVVLLFIQDDVTVYGYETNNGLKIIVGLESGERVASESGVNRDLKELFHLLHKCYLRTIFNPFDGLLKEGVESEETIQSKTFERNVGKIVSQWND